MTITDAETEIQAPGTWRDKETSQHGFNSKQHRGTGQTGSEAGSKSFSVDRDDWSWANSLGQRGQAVVGGMFNRLITKTRDQIEECESRTTELKKELQELEELFEQFQKQVEDPESSNK